MFLLVWVYNNLFCEVDAPSNIQGAGLASVYLVTIGAFGMFSGGCLNIVSLIGPTIFNSNFDDWAKYIFG